MGGILGDYTLQQLKDATVTVIRTKFKEKLDAMDKKQLIILYLKGNDIDIENTEIQDREEGEGDSRGQLWQLRIVRDVLGNKLKSTRFDHTYYPPQPDGTEPRDTITITEMGADDKVISVKKLKHYPDGKQPEWIK